MITDFAAELLRFFLLAFPALFSIINPLGGAFVFLAVTRGATAATRSRLARRVALNSFVMLLASMFVGGFVLRIFGISMPVLRVAGGVIIALSAWTLLNAGDDTAERGAVVEEAGVRDLEHQAFYPLTMPMTTGPGTISVAIALGTGGRVEAHPLLFGISALVTACVVCLLIYVLYRSSSRIALAIGATATAIVARLSAFLLFCIGIQVLWTGVAELIAGLPVRG